MSFGCFLFGEKKTPQHSIYSASQNKRFFLLLTETNGNRFDLLRGPELLKYQEWIIHNRTFITNRFLLRTVTWNSLKRKGYKYPPYDKWRRKKKKQYQNDFFRLSGLSIDSHQTGDRDFNPKMRSISRRIRERSVWTYLFNVTLVSECPSNSLRVFTSHPACRLVEANVCRSIWGFTERTPESHTAPSCIGNALLWMA